MKDITTEEAIILLKDFKDVKIEKDKLENYAKGGLKLGFFYTKDIQQAIEKILIELEKKDKIIDAMVEQLAGLTIWNEKKDEPLMLMTKEDVVQFFEKEVKDE